MLKYKNKYIVNGLITFEPSMLQENQRQIWNQRKISNNKQ